MVGTYTCTYTCTCMDDVNCTVHVPSQYANNDWNSVSMYENNITCTVISYYYSSNVYIIQVSKPNWQL